MDISNFSVRVIRAEYLSRHFSKRVTSRCPVDIPGTIIYLNPLSMEADRALRKGEWLPIFTGKYGTNAIVRWDNDHKSSVDIREIALLDLGTTPMYIPIFDGGIGLDIDRRFDKRPDSWYQPRTAPRKHLRPKMSPQTATYKSAYGGEINRVPTTRENDTPSRRIKPKKYSYRDYIEAQKSRDRAKKADFNPYSKVASDFEASFISIEHKIPGSELFTTSTGRVTSTIAEESANPKPFKKPVWGEWVSVDMRSSGGTGDDVF